MSTRAAAWLAWSLGLLCVALLAFTLLLFAFNRAHPDADVWGPWVQETVVAVTFPALGLLILSRRPQHPIGWLFCGAGLVAGFLPVPVCNVCTIENPLGIEGLEGISDPVDALIEAFWYGVLGLVAVASLYVRFRHAGGVGRQQIKWLAYAASLVVLGTTLAYGVHGATGVRWTWQVGITLLAIGLVGTPIAVGIAISRYRLYEIDTLINRTLVYGALTAALALLYLGGVATTQEIFRAVTSQAQQPQLAIVVSTLAIAALFTPLRRRFQSFIDRRFYRRKYDARKTLETFAARLRDETGLDALSEDLVGVVRETIQPAHVNLWLRPDFDTSGSRGEDPHARDS